MTNDERREILAQAMWREAFGETRILPEWIEWAQKHPQEATALRDKADDMLSVQSDVNQKTKHTKDHHHTGLGWLFQ